MYEKLYKCTRKDTKTIIKHIFIVTASNKKFQKTLKLILSTLNHLKHVRKTLLPQNIIS